jgi:hypothetical protein
VHDDDDECAPAPTTTGGNANVDDAGVRFRVVIVIDDGKCPMPPDMMASAMASVGLSKTPGKNTIGCQRTFGISACGRNQTHLLSSTMNFLLDRRPRDAGSSGACCDWPDFLRFRQREEASDSESDSDEEKTPPPPPPATTRDRAIFGAIGAGAKEIKDSIEDGLFKKTMTAMELLKQVANNPRNSYIANLTEVTCAG